MQEQVDERVSVRFDAKTLDLIDTVVKETGFPNRSEFLRDAVRTHIATQQQPNAVTVEVKPLVLKFIDSMIERGYYNSRKEAIKDAVRDFFTDERISEIRRAVENMEAAAGRKAVIDLEHRESTSSQVLTH